jgi:hypothetical protein
VRGTAPGHELRLGGWAVDTGPHPLLPGDGFSRIAITPFAELELIVARVLPVPRIPTEPVTTDLRLAMSGAVPRCGGMPRFGRGEGYRFDLASWSSGLQTGEDAAGGTRPVVRWRPTSRV